MELVLQKQKGKAQSAQSHTNGHSVPNKILLFNIKEVQVQVGWFSIPIKGIIAEGTLFSISRFDFNIYGEKEKQL